MIGGERLEFFSSEGVVDFENKWWAVNKRMALRFPLNNDEKATNILLIIFCNKDGHS